MRMKNKTQVTQLGNEFHGVIESTNKWLNIVGKPVGNRFHLFYFCTKLCST